MSLPILYIAGPMTGYENFNYPAFFSAAQILEDVGYTVINPADIGMHPEWTHAQYLRLSLTRLIEGGQGIALLPGWEQSRGAQAEVQVARGLELPVYPLYLWVYQATRKQSLPMPNLPSELVSVSGTGNQSIAIGSHNPG